MKCMSEGQLNFVYERLTLVTKVVSTSSLVISVLILFIDWGSKNTPL